MTVDLHHAEPHLSELIAAAEAGEDVVIPQLGEGPSSWCSRRLYRHQDNGSLGG